MAKVIELPAASLTPEQLKLIGQMRGRKIKIQEFDLLIPGSGKGMMNENFAHCCQMGWVTLEEADWTLTFVADLQTIATSYTGACSEVMYGFYKEGEELGLTGEQLELYVARKMPVQWDLFESIESLVEPMTVQ